MTLTPDHRVWLETTARTAHPEECCGILLGRETAGGDTVVQALLPADNVGEGDRRHGYTIDPARLVEARRRARATGTRMVGFYHSHPDGGSRPSARDTREAWPEMSYVIVPRGGAITSWRRAAGGALDPEAIVEIDTSGEVPASSEDAAPGVRG